MVDSTSHKSYIAPEDIKIKTEYALSFNPRDKYQCQGLVNRNKMFKKHMLSVLKSFLPGKWEFHIEKSDTGRLHIHGIIRFIKWGDIDYFYDFLHTLKSQGMMTFKFGETEMKSEKEPGKYPTWKDYINKQSDYWKKINFDPIIKSSDVPPGQTSRVSKDITRSYEL